MSLNVLLAIAIAQWLAGAAQSAGRHGAGVRGGGAFDPPTSHKGATAACLLRLCICALPVSCTVLKNFAHPQKLPMARGPMYGAYGAADLHSVVLSAAARPSSSASSSAAAIAIIPTPILVGGAATARRRERPLCSLSAALASAAAPTLPPLPPLPSSTAAAAAGAAVFAVVVAVAAAWRGVLAGLAAVLADGDVRREAGLRAAHRWR